MQPQGNIKPVKVKASEAGEIVSTKNAGSSTNLQVSAPTEEGRTSRARSKERGRLVAQGSKLVEGEPVNQSQIKAADIAELAGIRAGGNTTSEGSDAEALAGRLEEIIVADENRGIEDVEMEVVERTVNAEMLPGNRMAIETVERTTTVEVHKSANTSRRSSRRPSLEPAATTSDAITKTFKTPANTSASASASTSRTVLKPRISHVEAHLSPIQSQDPLPRSSDDQDQQQSNSQEREALVRKEQDRLSESSALSDVEISDGEGDDDEYRASKEDPIEDESSSNRPAGRAAKAKAVEKLTGRRRDSDSPPPAKRQRRKSNVITLDEDGDEESEEESIPQTLEILPVHPKVKTTYQKVSPARAAARKSGGRASKGREEEEDEIEEESDGEPKILSVIDEYALYLRRQNYADSSFPRRSIEDSSKEKTSRPSVTKPKSKKRSRDSDETDENFWNEPGTTTAPSAKSKRAPKASAAAKKSVEKPATKSTRGQRKSGESEAPTSVPKKLVGGMKKKGETSVSVEVARSTRGKGKARAVRFVAYSFPLIPQLLTPIIIADHRLPANSRTTRSRTTTDTIPSPSLLLPPRQPNAPSFPNPTLPLALRDRPPALRSTTTRTNLSLAISLRTRKRRSSRSLPPSLSDLAREIPELPRRSTRGNRSKPLPSRLTSALKGMTSGKEELLSGTKKRTWRWTTKLQKSPSSKSLETKGKESNERSHPPCRSSQRRKRRMRFSRRSMWRWKMSRRTSRRKYPIRTRVIG